jgi:hypothetical protein
MSIFKRLSEVRRKKKMIVILTARTFTAMMKRLASSGLLWSGQMPGLKVFGGFATGLTTTLPHLRRFCIWQSSLFVSGG